MKEIEKEKIGGLQQCEGNGRMGITESVGCSNASWNIEVELD